MRFNDVQDTRKAAEIKKQRNEAFHKLYEDCMRKLSSIHPSNRLANINGVIFAV